MVLLAIPQWLRAGGRGGHLTRIVLAGILCLLMVAASPLAAAGAGFPSLTGPSSQAANAQTSSLISSTSFPPGSPSARWGMALTFDASAGGVLVFSGAGGSNDTWLFSNGTWTELHTPDAPSARARASLAYDNATGQALLFGGESGTTDQNDTWVFSGGSWTRAVTPTAPSPRYGASLTYDAETGYFLLFGGLDGHTFLNDTWKFQGGRWTNITATLGTSPPARFAADLAFDPALGEAVLFGGVGVSPLTHRNQTLSDTWTYSPSGWVKLHLAHHPPSRWFADLAPEPSQDGLLLFGGLGGSTRNDTWVFANDTWSELSPARSPPARFLAGMAYDPAIHADVLFGGLSSNQPHVPILGDTWWFAQGNWTALRPYTTALVKFSELGLPLRTRWSVEMDGTTHYSRAPAISLYLANGTYNFTVSASGYRVSPTVGTFFTIGGGMEHHPIRFTSNALLPSPPPGAHPRLSVLVAVRHSGG